MNAKDIANTATKIARSNLQFSITREPLLSLSDNLSLVEYFPHGSKLELTTSDLSDIIADTVEAADENITSLAKELASVIGTAVMNLRETVNPAIKELSDALKKGLDAVDAVNAKEEDSKVRLIDIPAPVAFYSQLFDLASVKGKTYPNAVKSSAMAILPGLRYGHGDIFTNIATDDPDMDRTIHQWLANVDPEEMRPILDLFTDESTINNFVTYFNPRNQNKIDLINTATYAILVCDKNLRNVNSDTIGIPLAAYEARLKTIKGIATITLSAGVNMLRTAMKLGYLVVSKREDRILVLREKYYEYVENGGSISSLIGYMLSGSDTKKLKDLIPTIADDVKRYELSESVAKRTQQRKRQNFIRNTAFNTFMRLFEESQLSKPEMDYYDGLSFENVKVQVNKRLRGIIDGLDASEFLNLDILSLKLVCRARFFFTGAEEYLMSMVDIHTAKPGISIEDIRYIANIQYVSRYLSSFLDKKEIY